MNDCKKSTPCARLPRWRSELRGSYITSFNDQPISTIAQFQTCIQNARNTNITKVNVGFATINKATMHPQLRIPHMFQDQLNIIGEHLWELKNGPEWNESIEEALPCLEVLKKDTYAELTTEEKDLLHKTLRTASLKKQQKLTRKQTQLA